MSQTRRAEIFPLPTFVCNGQTGSQEQTDRTPVTNEDKMRALKSLTAALMSGVSGLIAAPAMAELNITIDSPVIEPMPPNMLTPPMSTSTAEPINKRVTTARNAHCHSGWFMSGSITR